jgi:hypothetical protein
MLSVISQTRREPEGIRKALCISGSFLGHLAGSSGSEWQESQNRRKVVSIEVKSCFG